MDDEQRPPTHQVHWRASCDVKIIGRGFDIHRTHGARVRQASGFVDGGLIAERCHFGPRRLILEGEAKYVPPKWDQGRPTSYGLDTADVVIRWTLKTLYGMGGHGTMLHDLDEPANMRVEVRARPLACDFTPAEATPELHAEHP